MEHRLFYSNWYVSRSKATRISSSSLPIQIFQQDYFLLHCQPTLSLSSPRMVDMWGSMSVINGRRVRGHPSNVHHATSLERISTHENLFTFAASANFALPAPRISKLWSALDDLRQSAVNIIYYVARFIRRRFRYVGQDVAMRRCNFVARNELLFGGVRRALKHVTVTELMQIISIFKLTMICFFIVKKIRSCSYLNIYVSIND